MVQRDGELTVCLSSKDGAVLSLHADGVAPLLDQRQFVEYEQTVRSKAFLQQSVIVLLEFLLVPRTLVDEVLQRLSHIVHTQSLGKRDVASQVFDRFASARPM